MDAALGGIRSAPLLGKKVYMHYEPGTRPNTSTERILCLLKAEIVQFFDREVDYVITNVPASRLLALSSPSPSSASSPSALKENVDPGAQSTPPVHPSTSQIRQSIILSKLKDSNNEIQRVSNLVSKDTQLKAVTRGRAMLLAASKASNAGISKGFQAPTMSSAFEQSGCTTNNGEQRATTGCASSVSPSCRDLLRKAKQMGIKILTIEAVSKWIQQLPDDVQQLIQAVGHGPVVLSVQVGGRNSINLSVTADAGESPYLDLDEPPDVEDPDRDRICGVRHLATPCVKVLDLLAPTRPIYMERTNYLPSLWQSISPPAQPVPTPSSAAAPGLAPVSSSLTISTPSTPRPPPVDQPVDSSSAHASLGILVGTTSTATTATNVPTGTTSLRTNPASSRRLHRRRTLPCRVDAAADRRHPSTPGKRRKLHLPTRNKRDDGEPSGYCECCAVSYKNLYEHVYGKDHRQFAENPENFRHLDQLLSELPSLNDIFSSKRTRAPSPNLSPGNLYSVSPTAVSCSERESGGKRPSDFVAVAPADSSQTEQAVSVDASSHFPTCGLNLPPPPTPSISAGENLPQLFSDPEADADTPAAIAREVCLTLSPAKGELPQREESRKGSSHASPAPRTGLLANSPSVQVSGEDQVALSPPAAFACHADNTMGPDPSPQPSPFFQSHTSSKSPIPPPPAFADVAQLSPSAHSPVYAEEVAVDSHVDSLYETLDVSLAPLVTVASPDFPMEFQSDFQECRAEPVKVTFPTPAGLLCSTSPPTLHPALICRVEGWDAALSRISIASPSVVGKAEEEEGSAALPATAGVDFLDVKPPETSPVLQQTYRRCTGCKKLHIPTQLPLEVQMKISLLFSAQATCDGLGCAPVPVVVGPEEVAEDVEMPVCCHMEVDQPSRGSPIHVDGPAALCSTQLPGPDRREPEVDGSSNAMGDAMKRESPPAPRLNHRPRFSSPCPSDAPVEGLHAGNEMPPTNLTQQKIIEEANPLSAQNTEDIPCAPNSTLVPSVAEKETRQAEALPALSAEENTDAGITESGPLTVAGQEQCSVKSLAQDEPSFLGLNHDPSPIFSASPTGPMHSSKSSPISEEATSPMRLDIPISLSASDSSTVCMVISRESSPADTYPFQRTPSTLSDMSGQLQAVEVSRSTTPLSARPVYTPSESAFSPSLDGGEPPLPVSADSPTSPHPRLRRDTRGVASRRSTFSSQPGISHPVSPRLVQTPVKQWSGLTTDLGRYQSPRRAAAVARQSITLSVQALYSPSRLQHLPDHECTGDASGTATPLPVEDAAELSDWSVDSTSCDSTSLPKLVLRRQRAANNSQPPLKETFPPSSSSSVAYIQRGSSRRGLQSEPGEIEAIRHEKASRLSTKKKQSLPAFEVDNASLEITLRPTDVDASPLSPLRGSQHKSSEMPAESGPRPMPFERTSSKEKKKKREKKRREVASDLCAAVDWSHSSDVPMLARPKDQVVPVMPGSATLHQRTDCHGSSTPLTSQPSTPRQRKRCYTGEELNRCCDMAHRATKEPERQPKKSSLQSHAHKRIRTTVKEEEEEEDVEGVAGKVNGSLLGPMRPEKNMHQGLPKSKIEPTRAAKQKHRTPKEFPPAEQQRDAVDICAGMEEEEEVSHASSKVTMKSRSKRPHEGVEAVKCRGGVADQCKENSASPSVIEELTPKRPRRSPTRKERDSATQDVYTHAHATVHTQTASPLGKKHKRHKHRRKSRGEKVVAELVEPKRVKEQESYLTVDEIASFLQRSRDENSMSSVHGQDGTGCSKKRRGGRDECFEEDSVRTNVAVVNAPLRFRSKDIYDPLPSSRDSSPLL
ncbi:Cdc7p-Dbf4p kinase complex regulatory subunit [Sparganum proliferum]